MDGKLKRIKELVPLLSYAASVYEQGADETMSNYEYDKLFDELTQLENETGVILSDSVTQKVGYTVLSKLKKVTHSSKMLSLDKTKDPEVLAEILGDKEGMLSWKEDGLTIIATYRNGEVASAVTRGNGEIGEDITENYKTFKNVPLKISSNDEIVLRGEGLISYQTFKEINSKISEEGEKYKNPRNLCSGSVRQLDSSITKKRNVEYVIFEVIKGFDESLTKSEKLDAVDKLGFETVERIKVTKSTLPKAIKDFENKIVDYKYPTDGLVLAIDDIEYSKTLGVTSKFPRDAKAFKWRDEIKETKLLYVDWSNSRTGAINPVAVFEPVELEGTTVERASLHNVSILEALELGIGDILTTYKANMIIPQVADNLTRSGSLKIPKECPICSSATNIEVSTPVKGAQPTKVLVCTNEDCPAKHVGGLEHFATRDAMNIDGFSEATIEKLVSEGFIKNYIDIYYLSQHKDKIVKLEGFGKKSYDKIINAIEVSRDVELPNFLYSLGVTQLGRTTSKLVCEALDNNLEKVITATEIELKTIDGIGDITAKEIVGYFAKNKDMVRELAKEMRFEKAEEIDITSPIFGVVFVVTGEVNTFKSRKELQTKIESLGGKVTGSVSTKTGYLINNDTASNSSKNTRAKELGVPIISEDTFLKMIQ